MAVEVGAAYVEIGARIGKLQSGLAAASAQVEGFAKKADARAATASASFAQIGRAAKIGTLAVAGGLALAMKSAADFDTRLSQVKAVTGATAQQMGVLRKAALDTSKSTQGFGYTAKEVADAQVELGKAGLSVAQIIGGGMTSALTLAKAGNLQLADSAAYVANAMQQFGMSGQQSAQVADALAQAANATTADVGDFGMALVQSGAAAKSAGMSFNQTMTALTALAATGVKGSDAGTSLKTSLIQLIKPMKRQKEAADAAGLSFIGANGKMRDMADISAQLRAKTSSLTQAQRTALFATLAGTDGVRTLLALYNAGPAKIAKYSAALGKQGTAQKQASVMNDNAAGKFKQLMATLQAAGIEIGAALLPPVAAAASAIAGLISRLTAFKPIAYAAAAAVTAMVAAFAIGKIISFAGAIGTVISALTGLGAAGAAAGAAGAVGSAGAAAGGAAGKMGLLASALPLVANPLGIVAVAAGAGALALLAFGKHTDSAAVQAKFFADSTASTKVAAQQMNQALATQPQLLTQVAATSKAAALAKREENAAIMAYLTAAQQGAKAGETEAQFQARIAGLYKAATTARLGAAQSQASNNAAVRASVDGVTKLADAGRNEITVAKQRIANAQQLLRNSAMMGQSSQQQAKYQSELQVATAQLTVAESRRADRLKATEKAQVATRDAIKRSSLTDAEKAASLDIVNRAISRTRSELKALPTSKTTTVKVKDNATGPIATIKQAIAGIDKSFDIVATFVTRGNPPGKYRGGYVQGFAGGGTVTGPGGRDRVPAMLTAGEAVLTKRQQALVNGGMSIGEAFRKTGAASGGRRFANGGLVKRLKKANALVKAREAQLAKAKKGKDPKAIKKAQDALATAKRNRDNLKQQKDARMEAMVPGIEAITDAIKTNYLGRFDRETQSQLKSIEDNFTGTFVDALGNKVTGSFRAFDKEMRKAQDNLTAFYDALTPAEAQIKALQDQAASEDLAGAVTDAQAKLNDAQDFGDSASITSARKQLDDALRAQTIAGLQKTAEAERAQREKDRQAAQDIFDTTWENQRTALQQQLDGQLAQYQDNRDQLRTQREVELEELGQNLLDQRTLYLDHWKEIGDGVKTFARSMRISGANIGKSIAAGLNSAKGDLKGAAQGLATILENFLKTHSPSKQGPLSDLNHWMDGFAPALMGGMDTSMMEAGIASAVVAPTIMAGAGARPDVTINLNVSDQTFAGMSREQADRVARQIQGALDRQVRAAF